MAGYRPKSLNELNDMYDKTITAEKAIIKASKQLVDETQKLEPAPFEPKENDIESLKGVEELSSEVDSFINRFKSESAAAPAVKKEPAAKKEPVKEAPQKISYEKKPQPEPHKEAPASDVFSQPKNKSLYTLDTPEEVKEKATAKSDERTELFDDYMKIMNDEDDDFFSKRESFKKKDKKKKHKKSFFFRHEPAEEADEEATITQEPSNKNTAVQAEAEEDLPVREVIYTPEVSPMQDNLTVQYQAPTESLEESEPSEEEFAPFSENEAEIAVDPKETETNEEPAEISEPVIEPSDFDIGSSSDVSEESSASPIPAELADKTYDDFMNESDNDIYSFDPNKENTIPSYAREQYLSESSKDSADEAENEAEEDTDVECEEEYELPGKTKSKKGVIFGRVALSILLAVLLLSSAFAVCVNVVFGVNTGKLFAGNKYIFTAETDYQYAGILKDDLVITEKRYANDGEAFAYISYTEQKFMFGIRNGSIVNDDGDVLFIAENDGERVLVLRDDTRGVVLDVYGGIGKIVRICTDNFIVLISALLISSLVIILILALVLKDKEKAQQKMIDKMVKKGIILSNDELESYTAEEETETDDIFSTID